MRGEQLLIIESTEFINAVYLNAKKIGTVLSAKKNLHNQIPSRRELY